MNNYNIPIEIDWWWLFGGCIVFSIFLVVAFVLLVDPFADLRRQKVQDEKRQKRKYADRSARLMSRMSTYMKKPFNRLSAYRSRDVEGDAAGEEVIVEVNEMPERRYNAETPLIRQTEKVTNDESELDSSEAELQRRKLKRNATKNGAKIEGTDNNGAEENREEEGSGVRRRQAVGEDERPQ